MIQRFLTFIKIKKIPDFCMRPSSRCCAAFIIITLTYNLVVFKWKYLETGGPARMRSRPLEIICFWRLYGKCRLIRSGGEAIGGELLAGYFSMGMLDGGGVPNVGHDGGGSRFHSCSGFLSGCIWNYTEMSIVLLLFCTFSSGICQAMFT